MHGIYNALCHGDVRKTILVMPHGTFWPLEAKHATLLNAAPSSSNDTALMQRSDRLVVIAYDPQTGRFEDIVEALKIIDTSSRDVRLPPGCTAVELGCSDFRRLHGLPVPRECAECGRRKGLKCCSRCKAERYCSAECQKEHWPVHKAMCQKTD